jgi:hypothetical protein
LTHKELKDKIEKMENKYDQQFKVVFDAIKAIIISKENKKYKTEKYEIGFKV